MFRKLFGTEKAREDSALSRSLRGLDGDDSRFDNSVSQSLPDLTFGPSSVQLTTTADPKERRGRKEEIRTERPKTSEDSLVEGSLCSEPGVGGGQSQVNKDPGVMYSSIDSLLAVPKAEIKRVPHGRAFSTKKLNIGGDDLSDTSAASSPRNSNVGVVVDTSGAAGNLLHSKQSQMTTAVKKSAENPEDVPREGVSAESRPESSAAKAMTKRSKKISRKQRYKTVTGSELLVPVDVQRNPDGAFQSDSEGPLSRSMPGWRSSSLKGTSQGKASEVAVQVLKAEATQARVLTSPVSISRLDDFVVLVSDALDESGDIQAVKVDLSATPLSLKREDLATYLEDATHRTKTMVNASSLSNVAVLLPSSRNSSSAVATSLRQFTNTNRVCIAKGNVSFARVRDSYSYNRYMFLTADFLFVMKQKTTTTFKLKKKVAIGDLWLAPGLARSGEVAVSFVIGWPLATNYTLTFAKADQKNMWMTTLEKLVEMDRLGESKRETIIQIVMEDLAVTVKKSLVVTSEVTVSQVVQKCLRELHLAEGDPDHYELCVKVKDSTVPLIGHEIPLYIQLKNSQPSRRDHLQVAAHHNIDPGAHAFDHFVLRQRKMPPKNGLHHRPRKTRRITLTSLFGRKSLLPPPQQQPDVLQSTPQAKLFGRSLAEVCSEEALPKPVMDLLRRLYVQGTSTPGIFRKPGNQRDLQDLKARLDAGEEYNMDDISIHVATSALKNTARYESAILLVMSSAQLCSAHESRHYEPQSFLRDLPDCLLLSNLYCKWIDVVCIHDNGEKQENTKRLVSVLPPTHLLLLRHVVCVLHRISLHSDLNQMTSGNLSLCLGPTFLWPEATVDLTSQFGCVELVARVTQMFIDDAQTIFGSDSLELFRDLDDDGERNESEEDSFGSHELVENKRDLRLGTSLESLDSASFDETQSYAVQSQMSVDSGLAVSNPLLYDDPESPTATGGPNHVPPFEAGARYAKRQPGTKKKLHTKSELSDISEALTAVDPEERPNSKMAGASNVRRRINRFQASKAHSDETTSDGTGDNVESSEDEMTFARASISSSEYMGDSSIVGLNSEDALSRDDLLNDSFESATEKVISDEVQGQETEEIQGFVETFRSERTERLVPSKTVIRLMSSTPRKTETSAKEDGVDLLSSEWFFTGPEAQVDARNLRPARDQRPRIQNPLLVNASSSQVTTPADPLAFAGFSKLLTPSYSLRCDRPLKSPVDALKPVKQNSLDSISPVAVAASCTETPGPQLTKKKSTHDSTTDSTQLRPRLTSFQVVENVAPVERSRVASRSSSGRVSSDSFSRSDGRPKFREPRDRSVPARQFVDIGVNVNESCFREVQKDDLSTDVGPIISSKQIARVTVGAPSDEADGSCTRKENTTAYKVGRRYKSDLDLASNRGSWTQDSYNGRENFPSPAEQSRTSRESTDGVLQTHAAPQPIRNGDYPFQRQTAVRKASLSREPVGIVSDRMGVFQPQSRAPIIIEQRVRDRRAVTVVTIGDEKSILPSKYNRHAIHHQPMSLDFAVNGGGDGSFDALPGNQPHLDYGMGKAFIPSEPIRRNLAERKSNGFQNFHDDTSPYAHESSVQKSMAAASRMLNMQPRSALLSSQFNSSQFNSSSAQQHNTTARQTAHRTYSQERVFSGHHLETTPRNVDSRVYVPSTKTEGVWHEDLRPDVSSRHGLQQRPSQRRNNTSRNTDFPQRQPTTRAVNSEWLCNDSVRQDESVRYVGGGGANVSASQPSLDTPRNARTSERIERTGSFSADQRNESSGVTWSVNELKKVFDPSRMNTRFASSEQGTTTVGRKQ